MQLHHKRIHKRRILTAGGAVRTIKMMHRREAGGRLTHIVEYKDRYGRKRYRVGHRGSRSRAHHSMPHKSGGSFTLVTGRSHQSHTPTKNLASAIAHSLSGMSIGSRSSQSSHRSRRGGNIKYF